MIITHSPHLMGFPFCQSDQAKKVSYVSSFYWPESAPLIQPIFSLKRRLETLIRETRKAIEILQSSALNVIGKTIITPPDIGWRNHRHIKKNRRKLIYHPVVLPKWALDELACVNECAFKESMESKTPDSRCIHHATIVSRQIRMPACIMMAKRHRGFTSQMRKKILAINVITL